MFTFRSSEDGQTMAEYAVILGVIAAVIVLAMGTLSTAIANAITTVAGLIGPPVRTGRRGSAARRRAAPVRRAARASSSSCWCWVRCC